MTHTIIEPFRIKMVEPLPLTRPEDRARFLKEAGFNLFKLHAAQITIDLLTDSGTGAMSAAQWAAMMTGDETYAGSESFFELERTVRDLTGVLHVIPTHQGRAAEHILFSAIHQPGMVVLANAHFDTTRANVEYLGGTARDLVVAEAADPSSEHPFKGNIDLARLEQHLKAEGDKVAMVLMTITNNRGGGQPVSLANLRAASELARRFGKPFFLDAARFAENAWLIKQREAGQASRSAAEIAREVFRLADGFTLSAKKDGLVNIGGLLGINDDALAEKARALLILTEGFPTYGGLAGRDLAALAVGLREVLEEPYLEYRQASIRYFYNALDKIGVPLMRPVGGHAVYIDAAATCPQIPKWEYPGVAMANELYLEGGVRAVEVGTLMFGKPGPERDETAGLELVRLTFPRRTYTQSHVDYLVEVVDEVFGRRRRLSGYRIARQSPILRAFTAELQPLAPTPLPAAGR
ncbi:MAG: tryptophanase [Planctomycetes bacterium]|nr:tryptophanase [Planctomycetota bacterium]